MLSSGNPAVNLSPLSRTKCNSPGQNLAVIVPGGIFETWSLQPMITTLFYHLHIYIYISSGQWPVKEGDKEINTASVSVVE